MVKRTLQVRYPNSDSLLSRFSLIDNSILRENITLSVQYVSFLVSLDAEYELGGPTQNSVYKNIVFISASVAEGLLNWKLTKMVRDRPELETECSIVTQQYTPLSRNSICINQDGKEVWATIKEPKSLPLDATTDFRKLITYAQKVKLFTNEIASEAEKLRKSRNRVHIASLDEVDSSYKKQDVEQCFASMTKIIECIESRT